MDLLRGSTRIFWGSQNSQGEKEEQTVVEPAPKEGVHGRGWGGQSQTQGPDQIPLVGSGHRGNGEMPGRAVCVCPSVRVSVGEGDGMTETSLRGVVKQVLVRKNN